MLVQGGTVEQARGRQVELGGALEHAQTIANHESLEQRSRTTEPAKKNIASPV